MKSKIFTDILTNVSSVCEISEADILSKCKRNDVVDARCIFIYNCTKFGIPAVSIANFLGRKRKNIIHNYLQNYGIYSRQSLSFRLQSDQVIRKLATIYPQIDYKP